jgi:hypothetical protein
MPHLEPSQWEGLMIQLLDKALGEKTPAEIVARKAVRNAITRTAVQGGS